MLLCWIPDGIRFRQCDGQRSLHDVWAAENAGVPLGLRSRSVCDRVHIGEAGRAQATPEEVTTEGRDNATLIRVVRILCGGDSFIGPSVLVAIRRSRSDTTAG